MFDDRSRGLLLDIGRASVEHGLRTGDRGSFVSTEAGMDVPSALNAPGSCFVTLMRIGELRGCCGSLEVERPLAQDVWHNAFAAAFLDPRFAPLAPEELQDLQLEISVLSPLEPVTAASRRELLTLLRPGRDGLVLQWRDQRVTFIPHVWEQVPRAEDFLRHLMRKAQWPDDFWAPDMKVWRYEAESIS